MEIAAQALAGLSPSARAPHNLHRERVRTDDSHIADCTARLDELCARVPIGEADARAALVVGIECVLLDGKMIF